jgi:phosphate transport system permease protein
VSTLTPTPGTEEAVRPRRVPQARERSDVIFRALSRASGGVVVGTMILVALFLTLNSVQAISARGLLKFLTTQAWYPATRDFGVATLATGTVLIALVALAVAFPLSLGTALFVAEIARGRVQRMLISVLDLMAAVPSVIYGLWGLVFFEPAVVPFAKWISTYFGWIPFLRVPDASSSSPLPDTTIYEASTFVAGVVVGLMIVPVMSSMMRESFTLAPAGEREGAYALGATRWGMIRTVVLPFGRGGIIGGSMLGLGRALGETIVIYLIMSQLETINFHILQVGTNSIGANIALEYSGAGRGTLTLSALMASGLALFVLTMIVNFTASAIIARSRSGAESEV